MHGPLKTKFVFLIHETEYPVACSTWLTLCAPSTVSQKNQFHFKIIHPVVCRIIKKDRHTQMAIAH